MVLRAHIIQIILIGVTQNKLLETSLFGVTAKSFTMANENFADIEAVDIGFDFDESDSRSKHVATKKDLPHLSNEEYNQMMERDPTEIVQTRMPDDFPGFNEDSPGTGRVQPLDSGGEPIIYAGGKKESNEKLISSGAARNIYQFMSEESGTVGVEITQEEGTHVATKDDLPFISREEYEASMNKDPTEIEQTRMPDEFPFSVDGTHVATKHDFPCISHEEYEASMKKDSTEIEQARMPEEFPFSVKGTHVATKNDLPYISREEYEASMNKDPTEIEQTRMPDEFPFSVDGTHVATKDDLPYISHEEYQASVNKDPTEIEQTRMPDEFPFSVDGTHVATKDDLPYISREEYQASVNKDPTEIEQTRMPDEFPFSVDGTHVATKDDLPYISREEYQASVNKDPTEIEQTRMPDEFPFSVDGTHVATKDDLPYISREEFESSVNKDPTEIEQTRMPDEFPFSVDGTHVATKDDLPYISREEYQASVNKDPTEIEQTRMPDEFPFSVDGTHVATKDDLPYISREEFESSVNKDPTEIEQTRMPDEFPFSVEDTHVATKDDLPHVSQEEYEASVDKDPTEIEQIRMPDEFPFSVEGTHVATKDDLPYISREEYEASMNKDPTEIEQSRMADEFPFSVARQDDQPSNSLEGYKAAMIRDPTDIEQMRISDEFPSSSAVNVASKNDLRHMSQQEYKEKSNVDAINMEQIRMPDDFPSIPEPEPTLIVSSIKNNQEGDDDFDFDVLPVPTPLIQKDDDATKQDLPHLTPAEYADINSGVSGHIEQARVPVTFPFAKTEREEEQHKGSEFEKVNGLPSLNGNAGIGRDPLGTLISEGLLPSEKSLTSTYDPAESEWDNVQHITARFDEEGKEKGKVETAVAVTPFISYSETLRHLETSNMDQFKSQIKTSINRSGFSALTHALFGPPKLIKELYAERDLIFCIAACPFSNEDPIHFRVLKSIYRKLTGSKFDPQRFGGHWDQIGFQGNDPASDLRGTGFLGLLQLLHLVMDPRTFQLARDIYRLSHHESQNFPMAVMSINMTRIALQVTREGVFNKDYNKRRNMFPLFNDVYAACYAKMFSVWKQQHKSIADSGFVIKDIEALARKKPKVLLADLEKTLEQRRNLGGGPAELEEQINFQAVCDFEDDEG